MTFMRSMKGKGYKKKLRDGNVEWPDGVTGVGLSRDRLTLLSLLPWDSSGQRLEEPCLAGL